VSRQKTNHIHTGGASPDWQARLRETFLDEAEALVDELESALLAMESSPDDREYLNAAFRAAHTIKGSSASVGCVEIATFTHELESALDAVRSGRYAVDSPFCAVLLGSLDILRALLRATREEAPLPDTGPTLIGLKSLFADNKETLPILTQDPSDREGFRKASCKPNCDRLPDLRSGSGWPDQIDSARFYEITLRLPDDAFERGLDPLTVLAALADESISMHTELLVDQLPALVQLDPTRCYLGFRAVVATRASEDDLKAIFEFCPEGSVVAVCPISDTSVNEQGQGYLYLHHSVEEGTWKRLGEILVEDNAVKPEDLEVALAKQRASSQTVATNNGHTIRVKESRIDEIIDLVGELVTARNSLFHLQHLVETEYSIPALARGLKDTANSVSRIVSQLQNDVLSLRMIPLRNVFQRLPRIVRDATSQQDKAISLHIMGDDTEIDKTVADILVDPMIHLVRNAADHGIERRAERTASSKEEKGNIWIIASRQGKTVTIDVKDDGRGIDPSRIRKAAVEKGIVESSVAQRLSDQQAIDLIFAPGFSTASEVSEISGRGVGMDIVARNVARVNGTVSVSSTSGLGTTIRLQFPLTISIVRALIVHCGEQPLALPLEAVGETTAIAPSGRRTLCQQPFTVIRNQVVPLIRLSEALGTRLSDLKDTHHEQSAWLAVVVESGAEKVGLVVDNIDQPHDILMKPLESYLTGGGLVSGAAVMGDGRVALVLDPAGVVRFASEHFRSQNNSIIGETG